MTVTCLITGHRGFVGRHLTAEAERRGWNVSGCDLEDGDDCLDLFAAGGVSYDVVLHCAAIVGGRAKIDGDPLAIATNMALDVEAFRWALRSGVGKFVYFSSSAAYPVHLQARGARHLDEGDIALLSFIGMPDQTYGWAKLTGEVLAERARAEGLSVDVYRPFSGYGTDQSLDYPFPSFMERARRHEDPFVVWGDGTQVRDFIHIDDITAAVFAGLERDEDLTLNLCTGAATSFNELARLACEIEGYDARIKHLVDKPVGVHTRVGNPSAMYELHKPTITLDMGIERALSGE